MSARFAVVGNPVAHSKSPAIHAAFAAQTTRALIYDRVLAPPEGFADAVRALIAKEFAGVNVTVPFKQEAFALATRATARARAAGAANTLRFTADGIEADNTDGAGLVNDLRSNLAVELKGKRILLLGAGGAARGVVQPLIDAGVAALAIANRTPEKAQQLAQQFGVQVLNLQALQAPALTYQWDVLINATSAGLTGDIPDLPAQLCNAHTLAYDMVYGGQPTAFMQWAGAQGARTADGLGMLVEQAAESFLYWHGVRPHTAPVLAMLRAQFAV